MRHLPINNQDRQDRMMVGYESLGADFVRLPAEPQPVHKKDGLKSYVNILRRRKWYIITPMVLILPLMALSLYFEEPAFRATAQVLVEDDLKVLPHETLVERERGRTDTVMLTEYQIMRSEDNIGEVVDALALDQRVTDEATGIAGKIKHAKKLIRSGIKLVKAQVMALLSVESTSSTSVALDPADLRRQAAIDVYKAALQVQPQPGGKLVNLSLVGDNPQDVALQINTLAEVYARKNLERKQARINSASAFLTEQTADLQQRVYDAELLLQKFREDEGRVTFDRDEQRTAILADLQRLHNEYNAAKSDREDIENRLRNLTSLANNDVSALQTIPPYLDNHLIQAIMQLRSQYQTLQVQRAESAKLYRAQHPTMVRIDLQLSQLRRAMNDEFQKAIKAMRAEYDVRLAKERALEQSYTKQRGVSIESRKGETTYDSLLRDVESNRKLYREASERLRELRLSQASAINNIRITRRALPPTQPVPSNAAMKLMSSLMLAGCLGVGFAFIREYLDNRFKEADEVESFLQIPFLGIVPHYPQGKGRAYEPVSLRDPGSVAAESYRILRTRIQAGAPGMKTMLVTSALPSEGKSTTTANLGIAFARLGLKVLLVDIDMRRPSLHRHFWISNSEGLATALVDGGDWHHYLQDTAISNLKILPTGFNTHNPSDLLSMNSTTDLLGQFKDEFDLVVFDGPIVLSIPDVEIIAPWMDSVVLVHYPERCDKESVLNAKMLLERVSSKILGVVFNNIRRQDQKYYYQQRTYYSQNMYTGAEQYDLGSTAVRQIEMEEPLTSVQSGGGQDSSPITVGALPPDDEQEDDPITLKLGRVIVNDTISGDKAGDQLTFLILELELSQSSPQHTPVYFQPESAMIHLENSDDPNQKVLRYDMITEKIQGGASGELALLPRETQKVMLAYRIPKDLPQCVLEYGSQRVDITIGF